ncbi:MAG: tRNA (adenine(58)-N(1))-methyltransferase non-catalytic subunit trm6 [Claussenomyces sp. TS43310]|nr:MAG: tRNA (adenine(58)-N(1))-methyltransferase non-catalytic subunit trm6 [Claussenomyces sp. TS43310]
MFSIVEPNAWVVIKQPSDSTRVLQIVPNTTVNIPKCGNFPANLLLGRPYHLTYEILDKKPGQAHSELRIVSAAELHADTIAEEEANLEPVGDEKAGDGVQFDIDDDGEVMMRTNRKTIDSAASQTLTHEEIEALKKHSTDAGKDLIAKLMASHTAIDQKTAFSLAKYKLLKTKKYLRQFSILPMDVPILTQWMVEDKDPGRIMEMREEMLALVGCWANAHFSEQRTIDAERGGRWLVVDEVGGLLVAAMAERMGILYPTETEVSKDEPRSRSHLPDEPFYATSNTITLVHSNAQPNLSLLKYFSFHPDTPQPNHPLSTHLKTLSWLQLLSPDDDTTYITCPAVATPEELASWKSGKRGTYHRKRRRHARTKFIVDEARSGGFDGLVIASNMEPAGILRACVPLLRGGAPVVMYSPSIEPLTHLADLYSMSRRTAFISSPPDGLAVSELQDWKGNDDFPLNPTLLLGVTVQTSRARRWQVLPGRTHPLMTGRGGGEGYVLTATRVLPAEGKVEARGKYKRRKIESGAAGRGANGSESSTPRTEELPV